ncbi:MAG: S4 domain-containing protein [Bacteroidales bacterium]|nr:S4 domain-containing protein [Bacteroidales bacterium]
MMKKTVKDLRIDKFLWAVRVYKTRSIASEACRKGRVIINDIPVKSSRTVSKEEVIQVKKPPALYSYRVKELPASRLPAKLVSDYIEDLTPEEEKLKLELKQKTATGYRYRGAGRPTKKERRDLDKMKGF